VDNIGLMIFLYCIIFIYGIVIGSFLNVCILRIPDGKSVVTERSHCVSCGYQLSWYDMVPVFSYLFLCGKCRQCKKHISIQYPIIEAANGVLWLISFAAYGISWNFVLVSLLFSALLVLSVIDFRTYEIPFCINVFIGVLGVVRLIIDIKNYPLYLIGMVCVSGLLWLILVISKGAAMGGGDVKLMAAAGLFLGYKLVIVALMFGCFYGSVIHIIRMKLSDEGHQLAMGPYLSMGIFTALVCGDYIVNWYLSLF